MVKKWLIAGVVVACVGGLGVWYFVFVLPTKKKDIRNADAIPVIAKAIVKEFQENEQASNTKYLNKVIEVTGEVLEIKKNQEGKPLVSLKSDDSFSNVSITLRDAKELDLKIGTTITAKGILTGFLSDVVIIEGVITKGLEQ